MNINGLEAVAKSVRTLSIDAIERANSGHPGLPLGCAELGAYVFGEYLTHNRFKLLIEIVLCFLQGMAPCFFIH